MRNNKILKYIGNTLIVAFLLATMIILNIAVQKNTSSSNETKLKASQQTKLNVAIVNEDQSVNVDKKEYNLGASYVKNIERDNSQNWFVVTRGVADAGLEKGKYQLVLTIPSDFSEKILDVNSVNVDKTTVTYKVNSSGNLQIENDANKLAKDIIADLNSQLVDMYMASILSNLHTAQQNVRASSQVQITNIGNYKTNLLDTAISSKNLFPTLYSLSTSSVDANNTLKTTLESYSQVFDTLGHSQTTYANNFNSLLKQRGEDQISYADFMNQLMGLSRDTLSAETKKLYDDLQTGQEALDKKIGSLGQVDVKDTRTYAGLTENITQQVDDLEKNLAAERTKFKEHENRVNEFISKKLSDYYSVKEGDVVTLSQVLDKGNITALTDVENTLKAKLSSAIAALPSEDFSGKSFTAFDLSINIPTLNPDVKNFGTPSDSTTSAELNALAAKAITASYPIPAPAGTKVKVAWKAKTGVTVDSVSYNGAAITENQEVLLAENAQFEIHYSVTNDVASTTTAGAIEIFLDGVPATSAPIDVQALHQAAASYGDKAQRIASTYQHVNSLLQVYSSIEQLKTGRMNEVLSSLLLEAIQSNLDEYKVSLSKTENTSDNKSVQQRLDDTLGQLKKTGPELKQNLEEVAKNNEQLASGITKQMAHYESLKERLANIATAQTSSTAALAKTDSDLSALNSEFSSLLTETSGVKASSQSNIQAAESANQIFTNFNRELANAQGSTEKLSTDSEILMAQFNEELATNGNFVESFVKVLNNAYENGVPNEVLLKFLSNPVAQNSSSVKATINVYRPFTWILLLEIVSLFTAYLFATQNIIRKVKDKFKLDRLHDTDVMNVGILSFLALTIGLIVGVVSSVQLQVGREYLPSWVLLMVSASFILVQGQYLLLKHSRIIGMGLTFFMMISFVYLSNAIGTTASLTGFPSFIKSLNALSVLEGLLSGYFDGQPANFFVFFAMLIVITLLLMTNIFVKVKSLQYQILQTEKV